jgi:hypothetical protein
MAAVRRGGRCGKGAPRIAALARPQDLDAPAIITTHVSPANLAQPTQRRPCDVGVVCLVAGGGHGVAPGQSAGPDPGMFRRRRGAAQVQRGGRGTGCAFAHIALCAVLVDGCAPGYVSHIGCASCPRLCAAVCTSAAPPGPRNLGCCSARPARAGLSPLSPLLFSVRKAPAPRAFAEGACAQLARQPVRSPLYWIRPCFLKLLLNS